MRSDFLVHWTGKDITSNLSALSDVARSAYVERLIGILTDGLWMTKPAERLEGNNGAWIEYTIPMTCFTEIRLSQAESHSHRYGLMGVGVTRRFVLERFGGPVHYVRNHTSECVIGNVQEVLNALKTLNRQEVIEYYGVNTSFIKNMSDLGEDNFAYLNEQEWRIVHTHSQEARRMLVSSGVARPEYRVPLQPGDVRVIVFPDDQTRTNARDDPRLRNWLHGPSPFSIILLTLQECAHF